MFSPMNTILKEMLSLRKTTTATTTFEHLFLVFVREDVAAAAREREGLCREEEGGRGEDAFCLKTLDSSRPLLEEGGESHFYTNFRRSVCVCVGGDFRNDHTENTSHGR